MKDKKSSTKFKDKPSKNMDKRPKNGMEDILADSRFAHIAADPRYKNISSKKIKVKVDKRFKSALMNEKFTKKSVLDPRGKPKNYGTKEGLQRFYDMESSESDDGDEDESDGDEDESEDSDSDSSVDESINTNKQKKKMQGNKKSIKDQKSRGKENEDCKEEYMATLLNPERDLARGDTFYSDDSSEDDSSTTDEDEEEIGNLKEFEWGELDHDAQWDVDGQEVEETDRFAVCCMDWDNVKAVDLLVLFSSFAPTGGLVKKVTIFPSAFGKARLEEEELKGPEELVKLKSLNKKRHNDEFSDLEKLKKGTLEETDEATALELEALRRYQRNRLKYYYAVVECDSVETSTTIYRECDRTHFEVIGVTLDLRYIPSDMEFDEIPHDLCEKIPDSYESDNLQVSSLVQVKPTLTWDDTDQRRKKVIKNAMTKALKKEKVDDDLLNDFVANSGSEEEDEREEEEEEVKSDEETEEGKEKKEDRIAKFRALISEIDEKESKKRELTFDMEETFGETGENDGGGNDSDVSGGEGESVDEGSNDVQKEEDELKGLTPFEKLLTRRKQKKKERKKRIKELKEKARNGRESDDESVIENHDDSADEETTTKKKGKKNKKKKSKSKESEQKMTNDDLALLVMNEEEEDKRHFDMRKIQEEKEKLEKKKRKRKNKDEKEEEEKEENFKADVSDSRFSALFTHGSFNVDPSHPKYNKHSSLNQNIMQKQKKIKLNTEPAQQQVENNSNMDTEISDMIRRFKMKTSKLK